MLRQWPGMTFARMLLVAATLTIVCPSAPAAASAPPPPIVYYVDPDLYTVRAYQDCVDDTATAAYARIVNDDSHSITVTLSGAVSESVMVAAGATVDRPLPLSTDGSATLNWTSGDGVSYDLLYGNFCSGTATGQSAAVALLYGLPRQDLTLTPHADGCTGVVHVSTVHDTETMIGNQQFPPLLGASVFAHITIATALVPGLTYELPPIDGENYAINQFGLLPSPQSFTVEPNCGITVLPVPLIDWRVAVVGVALLLLVGAYWLRRRSASRS